MRFRVKVFSPNPTIRYLLCFPMTQQEQQFEKDVIGWLDMSWGKHMLDSYTGENWGQKLYKSSMASLGYIQDAQGVSMKNS